MLATYRHFLASNQVLLAYDVKLEREDKFCQEIRAAILLSLRSENTTTPDHLYRNRIDFCWDKDCSLTKMLLTALGAHKAPWAAQTHSEKEQQVLGIHHGNIYVNQNLFELWQSEVMLYQSPVPHIAAAWLAHGHKNGLALSEITAKVCQSLEHSSLPSICENRLNGLIKDDDGGKLHDLHVHFNGSSEFTNLWLHALGNRLHTYKCLAEEFGKNKKTKHFYKQLNTNPKNVFYNLEKAVIIRQYICAALRQWNYLSSTPSYHDISGEDICSILHSHHSLRKEIAILPHHPFCPESLPNKLTDLQREGAMWAHIIDALKTKKNHNFAKLVHVYLLLMNRHLRLLVQQQDQYGFDQFQYVTCTKAYDSLENFNTEQRFRQFRGMYGPDLAHLEARFAPKDSVKKNVELLKKIWAGYEKHHKLQIGTVSPCSPCPKLAERFRISNGKLLALPEEKTPPRLDLALVAHFIKEEDSKNGTWRHQKLRKSLDDKANSLINTKKYFEKIKSPLANIIVGKDAASNELETPPEVFAPIFRKLKRAGLAKTTYHAGEDFDHPLSGIRAVHEAITFLELGSGDRIGHATALGIAPAKCPLQKIFCAQGHWLDNLVWLTRQIHKSPSLKEYQGRISSLQLEIEKHYGELYQNNPSILSDNCQPKKGKHCPKTYQKESYPLLTTLWEAWEMRHLDISVHKGSELCLAENTKIEKGLINEAKENKEAFALWEKYHAKKYRSAWEKNITVETKLIDEELILAVQDSVISEMREKNIIVEVLPSSNVRISHYENIEDHHVLRWLDQGGSRPTPQVVLGTDDPGIFATNLRNEYVLLFNLLNKKFDANSEKPYQIIRHLIDNSRCYRFKT